MTLFHEMYGRYFRIAARVLESEQITAQALRGIVAAEGFRDSALFVPRKLIPQPDGSDWGLLRCNADGTFSRKTARAPKLPLTLLQKRWLKAKLSDPKMRLFLDDETCAALEAALADLLPLYEQSAFQITDQFAGGDDFADPGYRKRFRQIVAALRQGELLEIRFTSGKGRRVQQRYLPLALEYSRKNNKFRVYCRGFRGGRISGSGTVNLGRMEAVRETGIFPLYRNVPASYFASRRCRRPVTVRVTNARNGVDRFLMEFASYEKHAERDLENGSCTVQLWYDRQDETELLIQLLSFGPVLEILGPPDFRAQAAKRIAAQYALLNLSDSDSSRG